MHSTEGLLISPRLSSVKSLCLCMHCIVTPFPAESLLATSGCARLFHANKLLLHSTPAPSSFTFCALHSQTMSTCSVIKSSLLSCTGFYANTATLHQCRQHVMQHSMYNVKFMQDVACNRAVLEQQPWQLSADFRCNVGAALKMCTSPQTYAIQCCQRCMPQIPM